MALTERALAAIEAEVTSAQKTLAERNAALRLTPYDVGLRIRADDAASSLRWLYSRRRLLAMRLARRQGESDWTRYVNA